MSFRLKKTNIAIATSTSRHYRVHCEEQKFNWNSDELAGARNNRRNFFPLLFSFSFNRFIHSFNMCWLIYRVAKYSRTREALNNNVYKINDFIIIMIVPRAPFFPPLFYFIIIFYSKCAVVFRKFINSNSTVLDLEP